MNMLPVSLLLTLALQTHVFPEPQTQPATPPETKAVEARKPIPVADHVTIIEENSLFLDGALANPSPDKVDQFRSGYVTTDNTSSGRSGLATRSGMTDLEVDSSNGIRLYAFILKPKEDLKVKLKSEDSKLVMRFLMPSQPDVFTKEIRRANTPPSPVRRTQITITNGTSSISKAVLMLTGPVNYKFKLEIQRKISL